MSSNKLESILNESISINQGDITPEKKGMLFTIGEWNISQLLSMLPKIKASKDFDRKMAAAFSIELEKEIQQKNDQMVSKQN